MRQWGNQRDLVSEKDWTSCYLFEDKTPLSLGMYVPSGAENNSWPNTSKETEASVLQSHETEFCQQPE